MNIYIIVSNNFRLILVEPPARDVEGQQFFIYAPKFSRLSTNMIKIIKRIEVPKIIMLKFRALQRLVFFVALMHLLPLAPMALLLLEL